MAWDLIDLGVHLIEDRRGADPEMLYRHLHILRGQTQDRWVLYAFRCAVHFASTPHPTRESLKWWNREAHRSRPALPDAGRLETGGRRRRGVG